MKLNIVVHVYLIIRCLGLIKGKPLYVLFAVATGMVNYDIQPGRFDSVFHKLLIREGPV